MIPSEQMPAKPPGRRGFLKAVALAGVGQAAAQAPPKSPAPSAAPTAPRPVALPRSSMRYPRIYTGRQLAMLAMPLGGVAAGSISLGGRGQIRDWEIFNRPDKGRVPEYAFASIWAKAGNRKPVARVLEARLMPPYEGPDGLGSRNAPGLSRLESAAFTGEFPISQIAFRDSRLPVQVSLDAFSPFIPLDPDDSGLPVAVLRYRVHNPGHDQATVSIAWSVDNPVGAGIHDPVYLRKGDQRVNEYREERELKGLLMSNPGMSATDPEAGTLALSLVKPEGKLTYLRGWINAKWWTSPLLFWDDFSDDGQLGPEAPQRKPIGSLCLQQEIAPGAEAEYTFLLAWHFPNRTPAWSGWTAPKGEEHTIIGNYYCTRFPDAWQAAKYAAAKLPDLEARTRRFASAMRDSTLPPAVRDAAMQNLSTLVTQTCFRTADGEFHGFEGSGITTVAASVTALMCGITRPPPSISFPRSPALCAKRPSVTQKTKKAACVSASYCPMARNVSVTRPPMVRWARSSKRISTGVSPAMPHGCAICGRAFNAPSPSPGSPAVGTLNAAASSMAYSIIRMMWSSTARTRYVVFTIWALCAPPKRWRRPWEIHKPPRIIVSCSNRGVSGSMPTYSTAITIYKRYAAFRKIR